MTGGRIYGVCAMLGRTYLNGVLPTLLCFVTHLFFAAWVDASPQAVARRVGFVLPLSGEWAFLGNGIRDAALLAAADLKESGAPLELLFEDGRGDLTASATAAKKLIHSDRADAVISIISGVAKLIKPLASQARVMSIGICSDTDAADGRNSFVNYLTAEQGVRAYVHELNRKERKNKSLGVFTMNEAGFLGIVEELERQIRGSHEIRFLESFDKGTTDLRPIVLRGLRKRPDVLLILGLSPEIELLVRQARGVGVRATNPSLRRFRLNGNWKKRSLLK